MTYLIKFITNYFVSHKLFCTFAAELENRGQTLNKNNMGYIHNYELPAKAEEKIHEALSKCENQEAKALIEEAQELLRKYLSQDNVVRSDAVDSYVKTSDTFDDEQRVLIRDTFNEILNYPEGKRFILEGAEDALDIINTCQRIDHNPEFKSVNQLVNYSGDRWTDEPEDEEVEDGKDD